MLRDAETTEYSRRGSVFTAFRKKAAKGIITEHAVNRLQHHGVLLAATNCVLLHRAEERAAEIKGALEAAGATRAVLVTAVPV